MTTSAMHIFGIGASMCLPSGEIIKTVIALYVYAADVPQINLVSLGSSHSI